MNWHTFPRQRPCLHGLEVFTAYSVRDIYCSTACKIAWAEMNGQGGGREEKREKAAARREGRAKDAT